MSAETRDLITWTLGTMVTSIVLIGIGARYILLPWLREHLVAPMKQVEKQVTENHHSNKNPTVLDRIDDVQNEVMALARELAVASEERQEIRQAFRAHTNWSERWVSLIEREMDVLRLEQQQKKEGES